MFFEGESRNPQIAGLPQTDHLKRKIPKMQFSNCVLWQSDSFSFQHLHFETLDQNRNEAVVWKWKENKCNQTDWLDEMRPSVFNKLHIHLEIISAVKLDSWTEISMPQSPWFGYKNDCITKSFHPTKITELPVTHSSDCLLKMNIFNWKRL